MPTKCIFDLCNTVPSYNKPSEKSPIYCLQHKSPDMINVRPRHKPMCIYTNCTTTPLFNYKGEKKALYCAKHKKIDMIDVLSKYCSHEACNTKPIFNTIGEKVPLYCATHKKDGMIDVIHKMCEEPDCKKLPCYANQGEKYGKYCAKHKKDDMINVVNKRCIHDNCIKHATCNFPGIHKKLYCVSHKKDGMILVNGNYCKYENCTTTANYNFEDKKRGRYCMAHKKDGMIDVKNKRCKTHLCNTVTSNPGYEGYCFRCFIYTYPNSQLTRNYKTKETSVVSYIQTQFPNYTFQTDKKVIDGCSARRPDCLLDLGDQVIICEIDETQHNSYDCSCENKRLMELSQDIQHRPLILIRFNPDGYKNEKGENIQSCWGTDKRGICVVKKTKENEWNTRLSILKEQIEYWITNRTSKTIEVIQLFYTL